MATKAFAKLQLRSAVTIQASEPEGDEAQGPAKFSAQPAYSGGIVSRFTANPQLKHDYVIDLEGMDVGRKVRANLDHKNSQRVGHATDVQKSNTLSIAGLLSAATPHRDEVAQSAVDGFDWDVSIEAGMGKPELLAAGKSAVVNGQTVTGPLFIVRKSTLTGIAFVSQGADEGNSVSIAASAAKEQNMNEFDKYVTSLGYEPEALTDDQRGALKLAFDAGKAKTDTPAHKTFSDAAAEVAKEQKRRDTIQEMALGAMKDHPEFQEQIVKLTTAALGSPETDPRDFELELMRGTRFNAGSFAIHSKAKADDPQLVEAALASAVGLDIENDRSYGPKVAEAIHRNEDLRNFSLQRVMMGVASARGYDCRPGQRITQGNIREVLQYCFPPTTHAKLSGGFSNASLPGILGEVANKQILAGYMEEDDTWREIAEIKSVSNFHTQNHYRMLDNLEFEEVGSGGEIKHGTLGQETYTTKAKTYAKMLGLTREQIINDDLSAFGDLRTRLGRGAAKKFSEVFWTAFINNSTFFTAALTNYIEGASTNLGLDGVGLELAVTACRQMTSPSADGSKRIGQGFRPSKLLVPPELEFIAQRLYASMNVNTGGAATATSVPDGNIHVNKYRPIVQNRLSDAAYTGNSAAAFYLFGDGLKPMVVSFLNGNQAPTVESTDADFSTLGIMWRSYFDFGCDKSEYLSGLKSKGAS